MRIKQPALLRLDAILDLKAAAPLAKLLLARRGQDIEIDGAGVERLGAQCLQVLLSARASWAAEGHCFIVESLPASTLATLELLGISAAALQYVTDVSS